MIESNRGNIARLSAGTVRGTRINPSARKLTANFRMVTHALLLCVLTLARAYLASAGECKQNVNALESDCHMESGKTYK